MQVDVVLLPSELRPEHLSGRSVVVFDVLRATTTITAALAAGVKEIRIFGDLEPARIAARGSGLRHLLLGERHAVKPPGFDLGNSPGAFQLDVHGDLTLFMTTTNGTKAILAAMGAKQIFTGALVNADALASALVQSGADATLLCSGTEGYVCTEDLLGAGAAIHALEPRTKVTLDSDVAWIARNLFSAQRHDLQATLEESRGGHNIKRAGLDPDIAFCAQLDTYEAVGIVEQSDPPIVRAWRAEGT
ncbi:MAG TPA: 2-phosphosulfolactate phosphatase [Tepidisphaeraceae bacterium]|nr:2-phosphosulfolactate phosphatase [Tepidisphaeraceae bacterium]